MLIRSALISQATKCATVMRKNTALICLSLTLGACGFQQYVAKPIYPEAITAKIENKSPDDKTFLQFLINNGYQPDQLPIQQWGIDELTFCALFFHPNLDVARAQWRAAAIAQETAAQKPLPTINTNFSDSNNANQDKKPYALGLSIDIPIETANKREIQIENASHLSQAAKLTVAQTAWQLRNEVAQSFNALQYNQLQTKLLLKEQTHYQQLVNIYQKRLQSGLASNVELSTVAIRLHAITAELTASQQNNLVLLSKLSGSLGLPLSRVNTMRLLQDSYLTPLDNLSQFQQKDITETALLNRLDMRIALEQYAVAETKLKLEIARQYPDIVISPGYAYEFGSNVWSLGLSGLLTLLNKNKLAIAEASQLREVEAAQVEALQNKVISEASTANAQLKQAEQILTQQKELYAKQQQHTQRIERQFLAGETDKPAIVSAQLEELAAEKNVVLAYFHLRTAISHMENVLQKPLSTMMTNAKLETLTFIDFEFKNAAS